jgi:hypothetical protein
MKPRIQCVQTPWMSGFMTAGQRERGHSAPENRRHRSGMNPAFLTLWTVGRCEPGAGAGTSHCGAGANARGGGETRKLEGFRR